MKKRFTSEKQILAAIDKCHELSVKRMEEADGCDRAAVDAFERATALKPENPQAAQAAIEHGEHKRLMARKLRKMALSLVEKKAKKLGAKLAEFRTALIPGMPGDESVQV